jgi:somatostatin receptor 4
MQNKVCIGYFCLVYICNLALADFLFVLSLPFLASIMFYDDFIFGAFGCHLLSSIIYTSMFCSVYTVCAISIDRFFAVASPLNMRRYRTKNIAIGVVWFLWIFAFLCFGYLNLPISPKKHTQFHDF